MQYEKLSFLVEKTSRRQTQVWFFLFRESRKHVDSSAMIFTINYKLNQDDVRTAKRLASPKKTWFRGICTFSLERCSPMPWLVLRALCSQFIWMCFFMWFHYYFTNCIGGGDGDGGKPDWTPDLYSPLGRIFKYSQAISWLCFVCVDYCFFLLVNLPHNHTSSHGSTWYENISMFFSTIFSFAWNCSAL